MRWAIGSPLWKRNLNLCDATADAIITNSPSPNLPYLISISFLADDGHVSPSGARVNSLLQIPVNHGSNNHCSTAKKSTVRSYGRQRGRRLHCLQVQ